MKRIVFYILFLSFIPAQAQEIDSLSSKHTVTPAAVKTSNTTSEDINNLFKKANAFYQNEQYTKALQLYKDIEAKGYQSDALYFNMANAYFKTNQVAPSIYYYEKALQLNPGDEDILFNLDYVNRMIIDNIEPLPKSIGQKFRENVIMRFTYDTWAGLAVAFAILFAVLFLMYHFSNYTHRKRLFFVTSIISASLVVINLFFAYQNKRLSESERYAIIFAQKTDVKSAPSLSGEINFELHEGTKVKVLESLEGWKKIRLADGNTGWIKSDDLKEI